jgi:hypothetical protein
LKKGSVLTDETSAKNKRWSESEKEAPIIKKAAYQQGLAEQAGVGIGFHDWRLDR